MKTAIYIEDGTVQLVITPESDFEKDALKSFSVKPISAQVFSGSFYDCRGGWVKQTGYYDRSAYSQSDDNNDKSLILRMTQEAPNNQGNSAAESRPVSEANESSP